MPESKNREALAGHWALITGAAKRIGAAIATRLHDAGANVAIHYFASAEDADQLAAQLNTKRADSALTVHGDLRRISDLERMIREVVDQTGRLDALINNASSFYPTPLGAITEEQWDDLVGSNLKAPLFLCQAALPHLRESSGVIVNIVDVHSQRPLRNHPIYGSAKAGLGMLTRSLAKDLGPEIRVNGVAPGFVETEIHADSGMPDRVALQGHTVPIGRAAQPEEIAETILWLLSDQASYVTGAVLRVAGGR